MIEPWTQRLPKAPRMETVVHYPRFYVFLWSECKCLSPLCIYKGKMSCNRNVYEVHQAARAISNHYYNLIFGCDCIVNPIKEITEKLPRYYREAIKHAITECDDYKIWRRWGKLPVPFRYTESRLPLRYSTCKRCLNKYRCPEDSFCEVLKKIEENKETLFEE